MVGPTHRRRHRPSRSLQLETLAPREMFTATPLTEWTCEPLAFVPPTTDVSHPLEQGEGEPMGTVDRGVPFVDLDADSDNSGAIDFTDEEDGIEWKTPGKVVRLNIDDDNRNGRQDHADWPFTDIHGDPLEDDDLVEAAVKIDGQGHDLRGYRLSISPSQGASDAPLRIWATRSKLPLKETYVIGTDELPTRFYVEGVPGSMTGNVLAVLEDPQGRSISEDYVAFTVVDAHLQAYRPQTEGPGYGSPLARTPVPRGWTLPVGIRRNTDDDDQNGVSDALHNPVADENDLIELQISGLPKLSVTSTFAHRLESLPDSLRLWTHADKRDPIFAGSTTLPPTMWVEWVDPRGNGPAKMEVSLVDVRSGNIALSSTLAFAPFQSTVIVFGGEFQVPADPVEHPGQHGLIQLAIDEYRNGYDVHVYDEDDLSKTSRAGTAFEEVVNAVNARGVHEVAIIGYSHGAGSTYILSRYLDETPRLTRPFDLVFTSYIDGIGQPFVNFGGEARRPVDSQFHLNQYQRNTIPRGMPSRGDDELDRSNLGVTHSTIDDHAAVIGLLRDRWEEKTRR